MGGGRTGVLFSVWPGSSQAARNRCALRTLASGALAIGIGVGYWSPRPLLFGLVAFALVVTIVERRANPWWLIPVVWLWVNSHGSFPLGLLWIGAVAVGAAIDDRASLGRYVRYALTFIAVSQLPRSTRSVRDCCGFPSPSATSANLSHGCRVAVTQLSAAGRPRSARLYRRQPHCAPANPRAVAGHRARRRLPGAGPAVAP